MYMKEKEIIKKEVVRTWVARDGKTFDVENDCKAYEDYLDNHWKEKKNYIDSLIIPSLEDLPLINTSPDDDFWYRYFKISTVEDYERLCEAYCIDKRYFSMPRIFPTIIACKNTSIYPFNDLLDWADINSVSYELIWYTVGNIMDKTMEFFNKLGYNVTFEKKDEVK